MKKILLFVLVAVISSCSLQTKHRGYVFPENLEERVSSLKTVSELQEEIGDPQTRTVYGDEVWIYYSADENMHGPFANTYDNKKVLLVWIKGKNIVKTKILTDKDLENVKMADGETQIPAAIELNALEELFNNVGRFSPAGLGQ